MFYKKIFCSTGTCQIRIDVQGMIIFMAQDTDFPRVNSRFDMDPYLLILLLILLLNLIDFLATYENN